MAAPQQPSGPPNNLALCIPALARAGQILCAAVAPDQARQSLRQAAEVLEGNGRFTGIPAVKDLADQCRMTADTTEGSQLVSRCRQLAAATARQVTLLAQEIQLQAKGQAKLATPALPAPAPAPKPAPAEPVRPVTEARPPESAKPAAALAPKPPVETAKPLEAAEPVEKPALPVKPAPAETPKPLEPAKPARPIRPPRPVEKPATPAVAQPPEKPRPVGKPKPVEKPQGTPKPQVSTAAVARLTIARTPAEQLAVTLALQNGSRFAIVGNGTIIDTRTNLMWVAHVGPALPRGAAQAQLQGLRLANHTNWRLPTPDELKLLLADDGGDFARVSGLFATGPGLPAVDRVWTSDSRHRFWFFGLEATCLSVSTGAFNWQKPSAAGIAALAVRSA
jgi:hypothetical protein